MVKRMAMMSDPGAVLVDNPDLLASMQATDEIADKIIADTTDVDPGRGRRARPTPQRSAAIRDAAIVAARCCWRC